MHHDADFDLAMIQRALEVAERGRGYVEPNPLVGAVVVRERRIVGEGWHQKFGQAHAEVNALTAAGEAARGATLYVTLEPCCHQGKTPPCTEAVMRAGISRVVTSLLDPFPEVAGQGAALLRKAGIEVAVGIGEAEAREQNAPYLKLLTTSRPYVIAKWAMSLDGKIATRTGDSRWISGEISRQRAHQLRGRMDAIVVGIVTALLDDPLLTARPAGPRLPVRIVLDSRLRLPLESQLVRTVRDAKVIIVHSVGADLEARRKLELTGCECLALEASWGAGFIRAFLDELGQRRFTNILVEGGAAVLGSFLDAGEIDEVYAFVAPKLIGGSEAPSPFDGLGAERVAEALPVCKWTAEPLGEDWLFRGRIKRG
jgi:diaminohydroxyphosphoribosylaminopyrimidine deaminase/5-amino-6-(5-phosphoribosylamino)uracil reductase